MDISELKTHLKHKRQQAEQDAYEASLTLSMLESAERQIERLSHEIARLSQQVQNQQRALEAMQARLEAQNPSAADADGSIS